MSGSAAGGDAGADADLGERMLVVGGGVAGLVLARDLAIGGRRVTLLEAGDRFGGQLDRVRVDGLDLDGGAEAFATRGGTVAALAAELGLGADVVSPAALGSWVQPAAGAPHPLPAAGLFGIPATPLAADVIAVIGRRAALRAQLDSLLPSPVGAKARTIGELVRARMGDDVVERLVAPIVRGVHSAHPDDLELDRVVPGLRERFRREGTLAAAVRELRAQSPAGSQVQSLRGGLFRLADALVADLEARGVELRLRARASDLDLFGVTVDGERLRGRVALAAPAADADGIRVHLALLVLDAPALDAAPRGTGVLVADGAPGVRAKALTHLTAKWPWLAEAAGGRQVVRLSYDAGGAGADASPPTDEEVRSDASHLLGVELGPHAVRGIARRAWLRASRADSDADLLPVGEQISGGGLANVVRQCREQADNILRA